MVTAECQENIRYKAKAIGIDGVLPKPIRISLLYETLSPLLSWTAEFSHPENDIATQTIFDHERLNDKRVLLIEDNPVNQEVAISMMEEVGIIVEIAENGRDGVEAALSKPFDLVLMDIQMPGMDGFTATRLIRRHIKQETLPIVAMTANAMRKDREKSLTAGMNEHLNKPVEANELYRILCQQLTLDRRPESTTSTQQQQPLVLRPLSSTAKKISWPQLPGIELERANLKLGNRPRLLLKLLASFRREHADNPQHLREWTATGNWQKIRQLLHTLQGVIKLIGAFELGREAAVLERQLHSGKLLDSSFKTKIENFSQRLEDLLRALEKIIPADREKPITTVTPTDNTLPADCRKLKKILQTLKTKLDQGELIDDELLDDLRQGARCPRFSPQAEEISAQIEDLELEAAGSLTSRLLADLEIAERE
jgi:CheY-like chemotaxis protein